MGIREELLAEIRAKNARIRELEAALDEGVDDWREDIWADDSAIGIARRGLTPKTLVDPLTGLAEGVCRYPMSYGLACAKYPNCVCGTEKIKGNET